MPFLLRMRNMVTGRRFYGAERLLPVINKYSASPFSRVSIIHIFPRFCLLNFNGVSVFFPKTEYWKYRLVIIANSRHFSKFCLYM